MSAVTTLDPPGPTVGQLLRGWRDRRRLSQMELALEADVSTRHLSFLETGRARPSRAMIIRLAEHLEVPLRERNDLLLAAGFAPAYPQTELDDGRMALVRDAVRRVLAGHDPYPALVVDRRWELLEANAGLALLLEGIDPAQLQPPVNALRLSLHPDGLAPRIANLAQWRAHILDRLARQVVATSDPQVASLLAELRAYPGDEPAPAAHELPGPEDVIVPLRLRHPSGELSLMSIVSTFGTPLDITVQELSIEAFFPADEHTAGVLRAAAGAPGA
ncbi:helix-turn-helix transcriptional regulator [Baekduia soli]|uniref:Helix-turn-helix transcriptional regulator n=1 Tax=Baekduia soli TaxID=496014 RepID=A0A5B8U7A4_9ACTN|nr:helix-turn-helix transcriptional regulator [Baekduia soli]QEC49009.1 helix-turn-helix transcriptional regulator [Baekduia soli]